MYNKLSGAKSNNISSAAYVLVGATLLSSILALLRDRLLAGSFGAGNELDIYYTAFRIPDLVSMILIMGAISAAIIPIFSGRLNISREKAFDYLSNLINFFLFSLIIVSLVLIVFVPQILNLIAPGFSGAKKEATVLLSRIMFLSPVLLGISNVLSAVLRVFKRFLITALAPVLYNLGIIIGIVFFVPLLGISGLAWGVVLGALLHLLIQLPLLFGLGFKFKLGFKFNKGLIQTIKMTGPRALGLAASQINLLVITAIGSTIAAGSIAVFNLANNLQNIPITLIGVTLSTAAFPFLSLHFARNEKRELVAKFKDTFSKVLFFIVPISAIFFLLRAQITRVILGTGEFGWADTQLTAASLGVFSFSIFAYGLSLLISKTFYAASNTKIPAMVTALVVLLNIFLANLFVYLLSFKNIFSIVFLELLDIENITAASVVGLPLAMTVSGIIQLLLLLTMLKKEIGEWGSKDLLKEFLKILVAVVFLSLSVYFSAYLASYFVDMSRFVGVFLQGLISALIGGLVYLLAMKVLK